MRKLVIGVFMAVLLMLALASSALAAGPDDQACANASGTPAIGVLLGLGCVSHP